VAADTRRGTPASQERFEKSVGRKAARRHRAEQRGDESIWFSLGMFGLVGWSVAVPTLLGLALGVWIDAHWPSRVSWTLTLLFVGVALGSANAWYWVQQHSREDE